MLRFIYFCFFIVGPHGVILCCFLKGFVSFSRFPFLSDVQIFTCEIWLFYRLKYACRCFSSHFCFLVFDVVLIIQLFVLFMVSQSSLFLLFASQVSRTLLSILADLNNAVVWIVSTRPVISKSSSPGINILVIVPRATITISITVTFMFQSFFNSLARSGYLSFFRFQFYSVVRWDN